MYQRIMILIITGMAFISPLVMAKEKNADYQQFEKIFSTWTDAFNHKNLTDSCNLFSKNLIANYQGVPPKDYASICNGFKKIFQEQRSYQYNYKLHQVYSSNNLAVARITWRLRIIERGKLITDTQDEGIDVFQQDNQGNWKIINYLAYPVTA